MAGLPLPPSASTVHTRRRVLLVDTSPTKRDMRADAMRKLGMDVDCAADIDEARSWWRADLYHLVLINMGNGLGHRDKFCADIRRATPPQQISFLVGKPEYLAESPGAEAAIRVPENGNDVEYENKAGVPADLGGTPLRWGILEASRRISAVRSAATARSRAMRERPTPPRDLETRDLKRNAAWSQVLPEFRKEEIE
jgi:CheY-like chemotaxis protein